MNDMNKFGGDWTITKIDILVKYVKAYLTLMNKYRDKYKWKLLYFDGFAGSGYIDIITKRELVEGAAKQILELGRNLYFDQYYFVEKCTNKADKLKSFLNSYNKLNCYIVNDDCNKKITDMCNFLETKRGKNYKVLAFIDPCGMQVKWESIQRLKNKSIDCWILVPTGLGINRLLKKNSKIPDEWLIRLESFLGLSREEIHNYFYDEKTEQTLFGAETKILKQKNPIERSAKFYQNRLKNVFEYVSKPYILRNSRGSILFHFYFGSNNKNAVKIANDIINKY